jgi:hypothetical protein
MKRTTLLTGLVFLLAAGTASAQTSVRLSIGFGVPSPYVSGYVLIGRPHVRPVYRPTAFHHRHHLRRIVVISPPVFRGPSRLIVVERSHDRPERHRGADRRGRDDRD